MSNSKKIQPEVLIYIQSIKKFFSSDMKIKKYFQIEGNEDEFFKNVTNISQKNFEDYGEPGLTIDQFEELRRKLINTTGEDEIIFKTTGVFISLNNLGYLSLN